MTCIVGLIDKKNKRIVMGADSGGSCNGMIIRRDDSKIFKHGDFLFGCSGDYRMMQITRYAFTPPPIGTETDIHRYLCTHFATELRRVFVENGFDQKYHEGNARGPYFILGYKNKLFQIEEDFQVAIHKNGIHAIGSGSEYAYGALEVLKDINIPIEDKIKRALKASAYYSTTVCEPFIIDRT